MRLRVMQDSVVLNSVMLDGKMRDNVMRGRNMRCHKRMGNGVMLDRHMSHSFVDYGHSQSNRVNMIAGIPLAIILDHMFDIPVTIVPWLHHLRIGFLNLSHLSLMLENFALLFSQ